MPSRLDRDETAGPPEARLTRLGDRRRLHLLESTGLLGGVANPVLDRLARLAAGLLGVPIALVSLVDDHGQHFPGLWGLGGWAGEQRGTTLSHSYCQHVVTRDAALVVPDAPSHPLVKDNLALTDLRVMAYAGVPLRTEQGDTLGALCAIDVCPLQWSAAQIALLEDLAAIAMAEIERRATMHMLAKAQVRLAAATERDTLTGLLNRRGFASWSGERFARVQHSATPFSIVAVSLDGFRRINAEHGHDAGDDALIDMAALLSTVAANGDVVARTGDDEFALMLTEPHDVQPADIQHAIDTALARLNAELGREYELQASVGIAHWSAAAPHALATLMQRADDAMIEHKRRRRAPSAVGQQRSGGPL